MPSCRPMLPWRNDERNEMHEMKHVIDSRNTLKCATTDSQRRLIDFCARRDTKLVTSETFFPTNGLAQKKLNLTRRKQSTRTKWQKIQKKSIHKPKPTANHKNWSKWSYVWAYITLHHCSTKHSTEQFRQSSLLSSSHHCSDVVYWREGEDFQ